MNLAKIREFVEANPKLVSIKPSVRYPELYVVKYKRKVFYDNLWTPELMETRGLVVDKNWNVVVHPFTKIFNRGENGMDIHRDESVVAVRKVNGFMACLTRYKADNIISTTGSLDSDFVKLAEKHIQKLNIHIGYSYIFEICDPLDPHIIPERPGAYLIGMRNLGNGKMMSEDFLDNERPKLTNWIHGPAVLRPDWIVAPFGKVVEMAQRSLQEGYVVYGQKSGKVLKLKSPYYLFTKFMARKDTGRLVEMLGKPETLKKTVDEEFYPLVDLLCKVRDTFAGLNERERIQYIRNYYGV